MRKQRPQKPLKPDVLYGTIWRMVDGAVRDAVNCHPEYFPGARRGNLRSSITKRVTGALTSWAEKSARGMEW